MASLKPCPFCGAEGDLYGAGRVELPHVECSECDTRVGYSETEADAIAVWNTRAPDPLHAAVDALLAAAPIGHEMACACVQPPPIGVANNYDPCNCIKREFDALRAAREKTR